MEQFRIFIVEDDEIYSEILKYQLSLNPDYLVESFSTGTDCLNNLHKKPSLITIDFSLPDMSGKDLLVKIRKITEGPGIIIVSGQEDITTAVDLLKEGAFDYIVKNTGAPSRLWNSVRLFRENRALRAENEKLKEEIGRKYDFSNLILGCSNGMNDIFSLMEKAAGSNVTVSVTGETGTGKELVAKSIHYHSSRRKNQFIAVNMGAIPKELMESELFGYEKGAFTGANSRKTGLFEDANLGTIFLDEIAEMDLSVQSKFLRVLQEREIKRLGGNQTIKIDVRVITATHKNLADEVKKGNFRSDLFYRIMGLPINLIPLRERGYDIIILARHFADDFCQENNRPRMNFTDAAKKKLLNYSYPGNVRELKAAVELAIVLADDILVDAHHINFVPVDMDGESASEELTLEEHILKVVKKSLLKYNGNPTIVARKLGISRATVYRYIRDLGLPPGN